MKNLVVFSALLALRAAASLRMRFTKFERQMKALGKKIEIAEYPDAGPHFENQTNRQAYRRQDAEDAWTKTITFLEGTRKK